MFVEGHTNAHVMRRVVDGELLPMPVFCPEPVKTAIYHCWQRTANHRPTFRQLVAHLEPFTDDKFKCVSYFHTKTDENNASLRSEPSVKLYFKLRKH